jgi:hypothetical protein
MILEDADNRLLDGDGERRWSNSMLWTGRYEPCAVCAMIEYRVPVFPSVSQLAFK